MGNITAKNYDLTSDEKAYIKAKNLRIINCLPRHAKKSAEIMINIDKAAKGGQKIEVEIIINVPGKKELVAHASSDDLISAYEVAENKVKAQARKYKDERVRGRGRGLLRKVFRRR
ncbi:MAG: HPF/RaiA family ribosome-associated protein [Candidatus Nomurabacteria bacterium]|jgi:ribosomal subunit interface protein|nr:HPF/RaiA family ribosome-associated protein [Candidatus Nomurabacteria bacterium]